MTFCHTCRGTGLIPATDRNRHFVMDCPSCGGLRGEDDAAMRFHARSEDLHANLRARGRNLADAIEQAQRGDEIALAHRQAKDELFMWGGCL